MLHAWLPFLLGPSHVSLQFDAKVAAISISLRDRMRFYKLRVTANAANIASTFNDQFKPEIIPEANDPFRVNWITESNEDTLVGDAVGLVLPVQYVKRTRAKQVLRLSDPQNLKYTIKWPFYGGSFNTRAYSSNQLIVSDVEALLRSILREKYEIDEHSYHVRTHESVICFS